MSQYKNPGIKQLCEQLVKFAPREVRLGQIQRAESLLNELDTEAVYHYPEIHRKITAHKTDNYPDLQVTGEEAAHDLRLFVEDLSGSIDLDAAQAGEPVFTVDELSQKYNVSTKTVDRWRDRGLVSRRFMFGNRKRIGFLQSSVEHFVRRHPEDVRRGSSFSQLSELEKSDIIRRARRLAYYGACPAEVSRRLSKKFHRSPETIRYTIKNFDKENPYAAVFPQASMPLSDEQRDLILAQYRSGISVDDLADKFHRTSGSIYRIITEIRAKQLLDQPIDFIYNESFENLENEELILGPAPEADKRTQRFKSPPGLPPYLASLYSVPLLSREEEVYYFRKFNYLKFRARKLRDQLDVTRAKSRYLDQIENDLASAQEVKNLLIRSNLRLVVSIAKRHAKPNADFFEMVSDGNMSLIRAIEKFDYGKGNKFSTYATWAIMKNFARSIPAEHTRQDRFRTGADELFQSSRDERTDQFEQELVNHRQHELIMSILDQLDEREREIIMYRFGLYQGTEPQTLEQVGSHFGVTKERIRQLESRALTKLRKLAEDDKMDIPGI